MAITPFKVIQGHRFWYNRKPIYDFVLVINITSYLLHCFQVRLIICPIFAIGRGSLHFNALTGVIPCEYCYSDIPLKSRFFGLHFTRRMCRCIFNHFYVIGPKSYRLRRNNANYTAITPFKVIQGHRFWYQSKAHVRLRISD